MVPESYYLSLSAVLFTIGVVGVVVRRNPLVIFMSIELMLNAANLALVAFGRRFGTLDGQVVVFFVMAVAAGGVAVGLAIIGAILRGSWPSYSAAATGSPRARAGRCTCSTSPPTSSAVTRSWGRICPSRWVSASPSSTGAETR